jgi:hypothetical protein
MVGRLYIAGKAPQAERFGARNRQPYILRLSIWCTGKPERIFPARQAARSHPYCSRPRTRLHSSGEFQRSDPATGSEERGERSDVNRLVDPNGEGRPSLKLIGHPQ